MLSYDTYFVKINHKQNKREPTEVDSLAYITQ